MTIDTAMNLLYSRIAHPPHFGTDYNNGVIAMQKSSTEIVARNNNPIYTFSDLDGIQGLVTGTSDTLSRLITLYDKTHTTPLTVRRTSFWVPFSNAGAHYFSNAGDTPKNPRDVGFPFLRYLGQVFEEKMRSIASHPDADAENRMRADAFIMPEAVPEDLRVVDERQKARTVGIPFDEALRIANSIKSWNEELKNRTTLDEALRDFAGIE